MFILQCIFGFIAVSFTFGFFGGLISKLCGNDWDEGVAIGAIIPGTILLLGTGITIICWLINTASYLI